MIGYLQGKILEKRNGRLIVVNAGIGYEVLVPSSVFETTSLSQEVSFHIHTHVREDELSLFGFSSVDELQFFRQLISVSGIGPKLAMGILEHPVDKVKGAILADDADWLTRLPGLGKKTAGRLLLELKTKIELSSLGGSVGHRSLDRDAVEALVNLGYDKGLVTRVLSDAPIDLIEAEGLIRYFLRTA